MQFLYTEFPELPVTILAYLGLLIVLAQLIRLGRFIDLHNRLSNIHTYRHHSSWALITGASDGIGLAFAHELSERGFNLILHGRNAAKLERVRAALLAQTLVMPIEVRIVVADASNSHGMKSSIESLVSSLSDLPGPLTVLINNVGGAVGSSLASTFTALDGYTSADVDATLNLNARFTTQLTRSLLPMLRENSPSVILNMGSIAGHGATQGMPYLAIYSGVKAYIHAWSAALTRELAFEGSGVQVLGFLVGEVNDTAYSRGPSTFFKPSARAFVKAALGKVGCGEVLVTPYWGHALQEWAFEWFPGSWRSRFMLDAVAKMKKAELENKKTE